MLTWPSSADVQKLLNFSIHSAHFHYPIEVLGAAAD